MALIPTWSGPLGDFKHHKSSLDGPARQIFWLPESWIRKGHEVQTQKQINVMSKDSNFGHKNMQSQGLTHFWESVGMDHTLSSLQHHAEMNLKMHWKQVQKCVPTDPQLIIFEPLMSHTKKYSSKDYNFIRWISASTARVVSKSRSENNCLLFSKVEAFMITLIFQEIPYMISCCICFVLGKWSK